VIFSDINENGVFWSAMNNFVIISATGGSQICPIFIL